MQTKGGSTENFCTDLILSKYRANIANANTDNFKAAYVGKSSVS